MKTHTTISVIVRTCVRPWFLTRALQSIAAQAGDLPEIVVVNDGGLKEETDRIVQQLNYKGPAVRVVHHPASLGRGAAWNSGIRAATGNWLAALDDDDTWLPDFCATIATASDAPGGREGCRGIATRSLEVLERLNGNEWRTVSTRPFNPRLQAVRLQDLVLLNRFTNNAFVFSRQAYEAVGPIREDLPVLEDWEFNVRFAARFPIRVVPKALARYHRRNEQESAAVRNTSRQLHLETRTEILEGWIRDDLRAGRFGLGALALIAEIESNRGLRLFNRMALWIRH